MKANTVPASTADRSIEIDGSHVRRAAWFQIGAGVVAALLATGVFFAHAGGPALDKESAPTATLTMTPADNEFEQIGAVNIILAANSAEDSLQFAAWPAVVHSARAPVDATDRQETSPHSGMYEDRTAPTAVHPSREDPATRHAIEQELWAILN